MHTVGRDVGIPGARWLRATPPYVRLPSRAAGARGSEEGYAERRAGPRAKRVQHPPAAVSKLRRTVRMGGVRPSYRAALGRSGAITAMRCDVHPPGRSCACVRARVCVCIAFASRVRHWHHGVCSLSSSTGPILCLRRVVVAGSTMSMSMSGVAVHMVTALRCAYSRLCGQRCGRHRCKAHACVCPFIDAHRGGCPASGLGRSFAAGLPFDDCMPEKLVLGRRALNRDVRDPSLARPWVGMPGRTGALPRLQFHVNVHDPGARGEALESGEART